MDDVINIFDDINSHNYESVFENKTLGYLLKLHKKYGLKVSLFCYYQKGNGSFNLDKCTDRYRSEFENNAGWMRFGFHGLCSESDYNKLSVDDALKDYLRTMDALSKIVGNVALDDTPRIHLFHGSREFVDTMRQSKYEILGLISADDDRLSYYLDSAQNNILRSEDVYYDTIAKIHLYPTDIRIENGHIDDFLSALSRRHKDSDILVVFTHEWQLKGFFNSLVIKRRIEKICQYAVESNYQFCFLSEINKTYN
ncbi:MAG: hypothetical protein LUC88_00025 [Prevotella sp.]|nr:hypothetical protein [Prevotella sp.]